jgi:hypothetical protein
MIIIMRKFIKREILKIFLLVVTEIKLNSNTEYSTKREKKILRKRRGTHFD